MTSDFRRPFTHKVPCCAIYITLVHTVSIILATLLRIEQRPFILTCANVILHHIISLGPFTSSHSEYNAHRTGPYPS